MRILKKYLFLNCIFSLSRVKIERSSAILLQFFIQILISSEKLAVYIYWALF